ncbi:hypothetical protein F511_31227 [Dorcoceras hygrometricum]|uniref:Uncharacterized protein n=1 Tax=Dorcoceras hygrometricum TaxID=472368 RepID=A0A2Z7B0N6_9LAMI|nr:hypothetical protein F511_31227 [Dorcoceras hygrometricum]
MASSLISNSHHIDFDSVFDMDDAGLAQVFETLIATGLRNFLGCPAVFYEAALTEFFTNGSVREDGMVVSTIRGTTIEISESLFATAFDLPTRRGSFDAVTRDRFLLMMAITFDVKVNWSNLLFGVLQIMGLVLGESKGFPKSRILDAKTVHRFVHINEKVVLDESAASPRVKRTLVKKAVFKKRPVLGVEDAPVVKKKRTTKGKPVVIAQEAVPPQTVEATTIAPVEQLSMPKHKSHKRKRKLVLEDATVVQKSVDEMVERVDAPVPASVEQPAVVPIVEGTTEDPDTVINQVLNQLDSISGDKDDKQSDRAETWFDRAFDEMLRNDSPVVTPSDTDEEEETIDVGATVGTSSLCKLATLQSEDIFAKEGQVLSWAETDSSFVAIQRRRLIIAKYRELLLRKFIEARRKNFVSGTPTSAIDLKVLKLLGAAHLFALKVLLRHMREHQLEWTRPSSSSFFEGPVIDRGFFIPPNHHSITSKCWIRAKIMVDGSWLILEGVDYWRPINTPVNSRHWEALHQRPYLDDLAPLCVFVEPFQDIDSRPSLSRAISIVWDEICMEAVQFSLLGSLRPVGSVNFCRDLVVRGSVVEVLETLPNRFRRIIRQGINCNSFVDSVVQLASAEIQEVDVQGIDEVDPVSSEGSTVYRSPSPRQETSASSSSDSPVHLNGDDIPLEENVNVQTTFSAATADLSPLLDDLKTSLSQRMDNAHSDILSRLHTIERGLQNTLRHQNYYFQNLIQNARQEGQNQDDLQILRLNELKKTVMAQGVTADTDSLAIRNRFNALDAKILLLYGQIGDLVDYIRGGDAKKGEGSSSRRPLPTPVNQGESSGNVIRTTEIISQTDIDAAQRDIMERMMRADRERDRERRERRLSRS